MGEMLKGMDVYLKLCNDERAHQECNMKGRTPYKAFVDGIKKLDDKKELKKAA